MYCFVFLLYLKKEGDLYRHAKNLYQASNDFVNVFNKKNAKKNDDLLHTLLASLGVKHDYQ